MEKQPSYRNSAWRNIEDIKPDDLDIFAYDAQGQLVQKCVSFGKSSEQGVVRWDPIPTEGVLFCQAPSEKFLEYMEEEHHGDPRSAMSSLDAHRIFGGHPDERISAERR